MFGDVDDLHGLTRSRGHFGGTLVALAAHLVRIPAVVADKLDTSRKELESGLSSALADHKAGVKCDCGNPIWGIGSAVMSNSCFTCITGEAMPDNDFEMDEAMK